MLSYVGPRAVDFGFAEGFIDSTGYDYYYSYEGYDSRPFFHLGLPPCPRQRKPYRTYDDLENDIHYDRPTPQKFISLAFHDGEEDPFTFLLNGSRSTHISVIRYIFSLIHLRKVFGVYNG